VELKIDLRGKSAGTALLRPTIPLTKLRRSSDPRTL